MVGDLSMFNQKTILILFIERNRFQFFGGTLTSVVTIDVPETIIRDFDVIQKDGFYTLIKQWVRQYNLALSELIIVYSDASYFEKLFVSTENPQNETDILKFFDTIPFESIWTKVYPTPTGKRALGVNKSLYEAIHQGFSLQGVSTRAVLPAFTLGTFSTAHSLDAAMAGYIIKNIDNYNLSNVEHIIILNYINKDIAVNATGLVFYVSHRKTTEGINKLYFIDNICYIYNTNKLQLIIKEQNFQNR
jgi:hypothetical protein